MQWEPFPYPFPTLGPIAECPGARYSCPVGLLGCSIFVPVPVLPVQVAINGTSTSTGSTGYLYTGTSNRRLLPDLKSKKLLNLVPGTLRIIALVAHHVIHDTLPRPGDEFDKNGHK